MTISAICSDSHFTSLLFATPVFTWAHCIQGKKWNLLTSVVGKYGLMCWSDHQDVSAICDSQEIYLRDVSSFSVSLFIGWLECGCSWKGHFGQRDQSQEQRSSKVAGTQISGSSDTLAFQSWTGCLMFPLHEIQICACLCHCYFGVLSLAAELNCK